MIHLTGGLSQAPDSGRNPNDTFDVLTIFTPSPYSQLWQMKGQFMFIYEKRFCKSVHVFYRADIIRYFRELSRIEVRMNNLTEALFTVC